MFPEAKSVAAWLRHSWYIAIAYVVGFFVLLLILGWHPSPPHKSVSLAPTVVMTESLDSAHSRYAKVA